MDKEIYEYEDKCPACDNEWVECAVETPDYAKFLCKKCEAIFKIKKIWHITEINGESIGK